MNVKRSKQEQGLPAPSSGSGGDGDGSGSKRPRTTMKPVPPAHLAALRGRYELLGLKGDGAFAKVWEARHLRTAHRVAVKIIDHAKLDGESVGDLEREIAAMRLLRHHPHVAFFYEAIRTGDYTYIVMELAESGQLDDYLPVADRQPLTEPDARRIFRQLVAGVAYCHRNMVVHRDLKLQNVLLDSEGNVKVADFGFSDLWSHDALLSKSCGSPEYAAPELWEKREYRGPEVDVWSCGVILYVMLCGRMPFECEGTDILVLARKVRRGKYCIPSWVSDDARDLIAGMLVVRQDKRATIGEVMAHRWLSPVSQDTPPPPPYLAMPPPDADALRLRARARVDDAAMEILVTRHGFERTDALLESLRLDDDSEAAVAYQLVLRKKHGAVALYQQLLMPPPPPPPRRHGMRGVRILSYHYQSQCHRMACAHVVRGGGNGGGGCDGGNGGGGGVRRAATFRSFLRHNDDAAMIRGSYSAPEMSNNILRSLSAAVIFEIELFKAGEGSNNHNPEQQRQYALHLKRTSGPQLPYLQVCSQLASKLRPQI